MSTSNKDIVAINDSPNPPYTTAGDCTGTFNMSPAPSTILKIGDVVTFKINVCNINGYATATNIVVTDNMSNLKLPTDSKGWNFQLNGLSSVPGFSYVISGTAPNQVITFNLPDIPQGMASYITYRAQVAVDSSFTGTYARLSNSANISYINLPTATQPVQAQIGTPLILFSAGTTVPSRQEVSP